jgi:drug/metabolite transporter (DMT)-like permease
MDKFLLGSKRIASPQTYAFYVGLFGIGALVLAPLGFFFTSMRLYVPSVFQIELSLVSGFFYMVAIAFLYNAIKKAEASRVTPVVFSVVPLATYFISIFLKNEQLSLIQLGGGLLLIIGGLLISFDLPLRLGKKKFFAGFYIACLSGIFFAIAYTIFTLVYAEQLFFNGFIWTRFGMFIGALGLLLVPKWRKAIFKSIARVKKPAKENLHTGGLFIANKITGGASSIMLNFALSLGSVTLINSMVSLQYVFVLLLVAIVAKHHPEVFDEKLLFWDWMQKFGAILIIAIGMVLILK